MITDFDVRDNDIYHHHHNNNHNQIHYLIAAVVIATVIGDSLWLFCMNNFHYDSTDMPELFSHKIFPPPLWLQSTIILYSGMILELIAYILLTYNGANVVPESYRMYASIDAKGGERNKDSVGVAKYSFCFSSYQATNIVSNGNGMCLHKYK